MKIILLAAAALGLTCHRAEAAGIEGDWLVAEGTAVIRIAPCRDNLCGKLAWTPAPDTGDGGPGVVGTTILIDLKSAGNQRWDGQIYNPEDGKTYTGHVTLLTPDVLQVQGCLLVFCGGENWSRTSSEPASTASTEGPRHGESLRPGNPPAASSR
jgi:uncharacterized protein (DUF2147 family)